MEPEKKIILTEVNWTQKDKYGICIHSYVLISR